MNYTVSVRKRSDTWSYQILVDGSYYSSKSGFKTKSEAKKAGDKAATRIKNPTRPKDSFKAVADLYIKDGIREQSTLESYKNWLKAYSSIYDVRMLKLSYSDIQPVIMDYYATHKYNGTESILRFGKSIVNYAIDKLDYDMRNPFNKIQIVRKTENAKKEHRILTENEMCDLFDNIDNPDFKFLSMCFGLAGLRISEARGLTFNSFQGDTLVITQQRQKIKNQILVKNNMKSEKGKREIPLHPDLKKAYQSIPTSIDKNRLIIETFYQSSQLSKVYNYGGYQITPHSLRHAYATVALQKGVDFKTLSYLLGDTIEVVMRTYAHVNTDMLDHARNVLTKAIDK